MISLSTSAFYERATQQIGGLRSQAENLQQQIGSGERLTRSSDDPVAAARMRMLGRGERLAEGDQRNSDRAQTDLTLADEAKPACTTAPTTVAFALALEVAVADALARTVRVASLVKLMSTVEPKPA